ncbi:MAG: DUF1295 domain-containing protein [Anaerolineales bacterium]|nr:DUF1295 domain-containing protein [Anaerolineales bacterium]
MPRDAAHKSLYQTSDAVYGIAFLFASLLSFLLPLSFPETLPKFLFYVSGGGVFLIGLSLVFLSRSSLRREGQPSEPGIPTTKLVTNGVFSVSRNPSYLGLALVFVGLGLVFRSLWFLIVLLPTIVAVHIVLIVPEERYLEEKFGEEYRRYKLSVRRWI